MTLPNPSSLHPFLYLDGVGALGFSGLRLQGPSGVINPDVMCGGTTQSIPRYVSTRGLICNLEEILERLFVQRVFVHAVVKKKEVAEAIHEGGRRQIRRTTFERWTIYRLASHGLHHLRKKLQFALIKRGQTIEK
jgi:hypothetical protein